MVMFMFIVECIMNFFWENFFLGFGVFMRVGF